MEIAKIDCEERELVLNEIEAKLIEAREALEEPEKDYFQAKESMDSRFLEEQDSNYCGSIGFFPGEIENLSELKFNYEHLKNKCDTLEKYKSRLVFLQEIKATKEIEEKFNKLFDSL